MSIERLLSFWARTAPESPMQRVGAFLMALNAIFCTIIIIGVIFSAAVSTWAFKGLLGGVVGLGVILLLLPVGIAHGLAACFPRLLEPWKREPNGRLEEIKIHFTDKTRDMYHVVGWIVSIGAVLATIYLIALRAH
ncbi:hypothetical protein [uncultured Ruegeria sp.]|uniref:hypothetical protein n=1 Tax=uncultured Ruegeria sp. TaxID=259304 RepID=UPI0026370A59|nr:hypothetical protein [uncultured Ruegeria sp.]